MAFKLEQRGGIVLPRLIMYVLCDNSLMIEKIAVENKENFSEKAKGTYVGFQCLMMCVWRRRGRRVTQPDDRLTLLRHYSCNDFAIYIITVSKPYFSEGFTDL